MPSILFIILVLYIRLTHQEDMSDAAAWSYMCIPTEMLPCKIKLIELDQVLGACEWLKKKLSISAHHAMHGFI